MSKTKKVNRALVAIYSDWWSSSSSLMWQLMTIATSQDGRPYSTFLQWYSFFSCQPDLGDSGARAPIHFGTPLATFLLRHFVGSPSL